MTIQNVRNAVVPFSCFQRETAKPSALQFKIGASSAGQGLSPPSSLWVPSIFLLGLPVLGISLLLRRHGVNSSKRLIEEAATWLAGWPKGSQAFEGIVRKLIRLSPVERKTALREIRQIRNGDLSHSLALALHDPGTWRRYLIDVGTRGTYHPALYTTFDPVLASMPRELRDLLYREVRNLYPLADKAPQNLYLVLPPKRALDAFLRGTLRPDETIRGEVARGKTAWEAYTVCFRQWRSIFAGTPYGDYSPNDVGAVVQSIQNVLRREAQGRSWSVTLGGSFPNGRALLESSDIDALVSDPRIVDLFPEMNRAIAAALRPRHHQIGLHLHQAPPHWVEAETGRINPILVRITPHSNALVLYPPVKIEAADVDLGGAVWPKPDILFI
ncbi:MAG: hypothetical protein HY542_07520 [Deltaproteobacteria bacterium]|nr:hypothetical protein [Deltaproteobacteria bacterium]